MRKESPQYLLTAVFILSLLMTCGVSFRSAAANGEQPQISTQQSKPADYTWDSSETTYITLNGNSIVVEGDGAEVDGSQVTITAAGSYSITGMLLDGQIIVDTSDDDPVGLILNGIDVSSSTSAPIYIANAEDPVIVLANGTENYVSDGFSYVFENAEDDEPNAAVFSKEDLIIEGDGLLNVTGNYNDAIASKDGLMITGGTIIVNAADDGIRGKDYLAIFGGQITVNAQGDGLKSDNEEDVTLGYIAVENSAISVYAGGDGIQAQTNVAISSGEFIIVSGGGSANWSDGTNSMKGIKAAVNVTVNGGTFTIDSADDGVHANDSLVINNGSFSIATSDDGMHADSTLEVNGGNINITSSYEGLESGTITINDGNVYITSSDDGINVAGGNDGSGLAAEGGRGGAGQDAFAVGDYYLYINGGYIVMNAGGDGLDSNGWFDMTGGVVVVNGPTEDRNGAIDVNGDFSISGGFLVAVGSSGMAEAPDESSTQYSMLLNFDTALSAGTLVHIQASDGSEIITFEAAKQFQSIVVSSPEFTSGVTYEVYYGGSASGVAQDGLYQDATVSDATQYTSFTISSTVTSLGAVSNFGGGGTRGGGPGNRG